MRRMVPCPRCKAVINQQFPDVTPAEARELEDNDDYSEVVITCPNCKKAIHILRRLLPGLPPPP